MQAIRCEQGDQDAAVTQMWKDGRTTGTCVYSIIFAKILASFIPSWQRRNVRKSEIIQVLQRRNRGAVDDSLQQ